MSLVSIPVITYNQEKWIAETLDGILNQQTTFDFEIVIGEDFSTDQTRAICEAYKKEHPEKINLLPSPKNFGANANFVRTLSVCTGKYIAICEGDDYWTDPLKLQKQVDVLEAYSSIAMVYSDAATITDGKLGEFYKEKRPKGVFDLQKFIYEYQKISVPTATSMIRSEAIMYSKELLLKKENQVLQADYVIWYCAGTFGNYHFMEEKTAVYRMHSAGIMGTMSASRKWLESSMHLNHLLGDEIAPSFHSYAHASDWWYYLEFSFFDVKAKKWHSSVKYLFKSLLAATRSGRTNHVQIMRDYFYRLRHA